MKSLRFSLSILLGASETFFCFSAASVLGSSLFPVPVLGGRVVLKVNLGRRMDGSNGLLGKCSFKSYLFIYFGGLFSSDHS